MMGLLLARLDGLDPAATPAPTRLASVLAALVREAEAKELLT
jgi:hypothetical protein